MLIPDDLIAAGRSYMDVRWLHQGRSRMGVDCVGLVLCALTDIGLPAPDMQGYRREPNPAIFLSHIRENTLFSAKPEPGTMGIFRDGTQPCHVGIFTEQHGDLYLLHAYAGVGKVMEEPFDHQWPQNLIEVRRFKGLEY